MEEAEPLVLWDNEIKSGVEAMQLDKGGRMQRGIQMIGEQGTR